MICREGTTKDISADGVCISIGNVPPDKVAIAVEVHLPWKRVRRRDLACCSADSLTFRGEGRVIRICDDLESFAATMYFHSVDASDFIDGEPHLVELKGLVS